MHPIGTLATATVRGTPNTRVLAATDGRNTGWISAIPVASFTFHDDTLVTDVTAHTTTTATDDEIALLRSITDELPPEAYDGALVVLADRLEAGRAMPKPVEPTRRGALVLDQDNHQWVRTHPADPASWAQHETARFGHTYDQIDAVAVLA